MDPGHSMARSKPSSLQTRTTRFAQSLIVLVYGARISVDLLVSGLGGLGTSTGGLNLNAGKADFGISTLQPAMNRVAAHTVTATIAVMHLAL